MFYSGPPVILVKVEVTRSYVLWTLSWWSTVMIVMFSISFPNSSVLMTFLDGLNPYFYTFTKVSLRDIFRSPHRSLWKHVYFTASLLLTIHEGYGKIIILSEVVEWPVVVFLLVQNLILPSNKQVVKSLKIKDRDLYVRYNVGSRVHVHTHTPVCVCV